MRFEHAMHCSWGVVWCFADLLSNGSKAGLLIEERHIIYVTNALSCFLLVKDGVSHVVCSSHVGVVA